MAYSQLPEEGAGESAYIRQALERRAADYYVQLRTPKETWKNIDDLEPQLVEFEHRVRAGDYDDAYQVLEPIDYDHLFLWGYYTRLVGLREQLIDRLVDSTQVINLNNLGLVYGILGQVERAIRFYEQALAIARKIDDRLWEGAVLGNLGYTYYILGQVEQAIKLYEEALIIARETGDRQGESIWFGNLGDVYRVLGQIDQAISFHEQALIIAREINDRRWEGDSLGLLGRTYHDLGRFERAIGFYKQALTIAHEINDHWHKSTWLGNLGRAYCDLGQIERAIKFYEEALTIAHKIGDRREESYHLLGMGKTLLAIGELSKSSRCYTEALALDIPDTNYHVMLALGIVLLLQHKVGTRKIFIDAISHCQAILDKTASLYEPRYVLATALVGKAATNPGWVEQEKRSELLTPALTEYQRALEITAAPGIVQDAIRNLELIQAAGIEGLEPVFELLESALEENDN